MRTHFTILTRKFLLMFRSNSHTFKFHQTKISFFFFSVLYLTTMKFYGTLLALCLAQTAAFQVQTPKALFNGQVARESQSPLFSSYLDNMGGAPGTSQPFPAAPTPTAQALESRLSQLEQGRSPEGVSLRNIWDRATPVTVQGGSLKTWSFVSPSLERIQVVMKTEGRPLDADLELWQGPDNTPTKMRIYVEDGALREFSAVVETPRQGPNTIAIRNIANLEFPITAAVAAINTGAPGAQLSEGKSMIIQGGALRTYPFEATVDSIQVLLMTDGRPLNARIELLQGPNNNKQVMEIYTEDGLERPFYAVIETPGSGNVVRVVNTATVEFPLTAWAEPYSIANPSEYSIDPILGGDN